MATLAFFGWRLEGKESSGRIHFGPPPGTALWGSRDLYLTATSGSALLKTDQNLPLRFALEGINVEIELDPTRVRVDESAGSVWRIRDVKDGVLLRLGTPQSAQEKH